MEKIIYQHMGQNSTGETGEHPPQPISPENQKPRPETAPVERVSLLRKEPKRVPSRAQRPETAGRVAGSEKPSLLSEHVTSPVERSFEEKGKAQKDHLKNESKKMQKINPDDPNDAERNKFIDEHADEIPGLKGKSDEEVDKKLDEWGVDDESKQVIRSRLQEGMPAPLHGENKGEDGKSAPLEGEAPADPEAVPPELQEEIDDALKPVPEGEDAAAQLDKANKLLKGLGKWAGRLGKLLLYTIMYAAITYVWGVKTFSGKHGK